MTNTSSTQPVTAAQVAAAVEAMTRDAVLAQRRVDRLRAGLRGATEQRNALVRQVASMNVERKALAARLGIDRAHMYSILNASDDPEEDARVAAEAQDAAETAYTLWEINGREGQPDDYWPTS